MNIHRLPVPGGEVQARELDFEIETEAWSVYKLSDGGKVRLRATALRIMRVLDADGKPTFTADGQPNVILTNQVQIVAVD